ncbi:MAG TPA: hypothetical protein VG276_28875 [Actinomycetes bacterium]|jgi:hypothetical protein|nr:hypothetical protein [Actinomycetes bacterium]
MKAEQAIALLSGDWPPKIDEHWPPKDKARWRRGMHLQGLIEAVLHPPRPDGSKHRGEPYLALYVRRLVDGRLVMWHGWHTAAEDVPAMQPAPGLLFTAVYRGQGANDFEDFKYLVTPYDPPESTGSAPLPGDDRPPERPRGQVSPRRTVTPSVTDRPPPPPPAAGPVTREAQAEATATRNGRRPAPGTAAKIAEREAGIPTEEAIAAVRDRADGHRLLLAASPEFRAAATADGTLWASTDAARWREYLAETRRAFLGQEAPA